MIRKRVPIIIFIALIGLGIILIKEYQIKETMQLTQEEALQDHFYDQYEGISEQFVRKSFTNKEHGVQDEESILTSLNLLYMEYLLKENNRADFEKVTRFIQENLLTKEGLVGFGAYENMEVGSMEVIEQVSVIDTLKFYKLLTKAHLIWGDSYYSNLAEMMHPYDLKENQFNVMNSQTIDQKELELYKFDLKGIALLEKEEMMQKNIYKKAKKVLKKAYINNTCPLYYTHYDLANETYIKTERVNTLESLLICKELSKNNALKKETIRWLKNQLKSGSIYEQYDVKTGLVTSHQENIAVYAIVAQIGKLEGDIELYTLAMEKMLKFQVKDFESELYGSFINQETGRADCYENLQALLAF